MPRRPLRFEEPLRSDLRKTNTSRRTVSLPTFLVDELAAHMERGGSELVFTGAACRPLQRTNFRRRYWLPAVQASVGLPCRFHDLRHTHAAWLIEQGEHAKVIQARLGHASIRTTLDQYGHLFDGHDAVAADALDTRFLQARADSALTLDEPTVVNL